MWLYAFGSLVRGEVDVHSDTDLLCIESSGSHSMLPNTVQRYSIAELSTIFCAGDLFAHHLHAESRLLYSSTDDDVIRDLGPPAPYTSWESELLTFYEVVQYSTVELRMNPSSVFHKGIAYMGLRDMGMIYSCASTGTANFSKYSPYQVLPTLDLPRDIYEHLRMCRLHSTRSALRPESVSPILPQHLSSIESWAHQINSWRLRNAS